MANPKRRQRYGSSVRASRGSATVECGFRQDCRLREFIFGLTDDELRMALDNVDEADLGPVFGHIGFQPKIHTHRGRQVFRARLRGIPQEVLHYTAAVFASHPTIELARSLGLRFLGEDGEEEQQENIDVYAVMRAGGLAILVERWPLGIVRVALENLWDDGSLTTNQRDEFLAAASDPTALAALAAKDSADANKTVAPLSSSTTVVPVAAGSADRGSTTGLQEDGHEEDGEIGEKVVCGDDRARVRALREAATSNQPARPPSTPPVRTARVNAAAATSLDTLLAQAVDIAEATPAGEMELNRLTAALECVVMLDPVREDLWRLYGRVVAMWPPTTDHAFRQILQASLPATRLEFLRGQLHTFATRGDNDRVSAIVLKNQNEAEQLLLLPATVSTDPVAAAVLTAYLNEPRQAARLLHLVTEPFASWGQYMQAARARATDLIGSGAAIEAEILLREVEATLWTWSARPDRPGRGLEREATEVALLRGVCRRHRRDFAGALQLLEGLDRELLDTAGHATLSRETGLAIAEVAGLEVVAFPRRGAEKVQLRERLARARPHLEAALEGGTGSDGPELIATVLLGILAACEDDDAAAARHLGAAAPMLAERPPAAELARAVAFHAALARLRLLEPGTDDAAFHDMSVAIVNGYVPADAQLLSAAVALEAHASPHAGAFLATAASLAPNEAGLIDLLAERARRSDSAALAAAEERACDTRLSLATRYLLLDSVLVGAGRRNDVAAAARLADEIDEVLVRAGQVSLDESWAETLGTDETLRLALEPAHADAARLEVLRRVGRLDEARAIAKSLFYRAANGTLRGFDAGDLAGLLAELGMPEEELADLERLVHERSGEQPAEFAEQLTAPLRVIFVGGSPVQEQYVPHLEAVFSERYRGMVAVDWFMTGWGSNWSLAAERIETAYDGASAVVVMTFVRTNLGRWTRRTAGEHGLPWLSCTGHGRASLERAIDRAVAVAVEQATLDAR